MARAQPKKRSGRKPSAIGAFACVRVSRLPLAMAFSAALGCAGAKHDAGDELARTAPSAQGPGERVPLQTFAHGLDHVRVRPTVVLRVGRDLQHADVSTLIVEYPVEGDPAERDVWCDADTRDWRGARALAFRVRVEHPLKLSVSFFDGNRVAYTAWVNAAGYGGVWQELEIALDAIRPNPYFQPPEAKLGAPIDLHDIKEFAFAPHEPGAGRFEVAGWALVR